MSRIECLVNLQYTFAHVFPFGDENYDIDSSGMFNSAGTITWHKMILFQHRRAVHLLVQSAILKWSLKCWDAMQKLSTDLYGHWTTFSVEFSSCGAFAYDLPVLYSETCRLIIWIENIRLKALRAVRGNWFVIHYKCVNLIGITLRA